jgi:hypothetical protein
MPKKTEIKQAPTIKQCQSNCTKQYKGNNLSCNTMRPGPQKNICYSKNTEIYKKCVSNGRKFCK